MKKESKTDELKKEYDLSKLTGRVRGKYTGRYNAGTNLVLLDDDVAVAFPTPKAVNDGLRDLMRNRQNTSRILK